MFYKNQLAEEVTKYLSIIQAYVHMQNCKGLFDINKYCEDVFCGLLNIVCDLNLINLNRIDYNFPAVDLGDYNRRICFQVTSTNDISKIRYTVDKFIEKELNKDFDNLFIFILGNKKNYTADINTGENLVFDISKNVMDISDLAIAINDFKDDKINAVLGYLKSTVMLNFTDDYRDKELFNSFNNAIRNCIKLLRDSEYDFAFTPTPENLISEFQAIINEWCFPDKKFSMQILEDNKNIIINSMNEINSYLKSPIYFQYHPVDGFIMPKKDPERKLFNEMQNTTFNLRKIIIEAHNQMCELLIQ
ncbi:SMEK domain-containing protein [Clostridium saccharobutylicum]|uniref:SMEK domain-containing protein n=3 Tax=Clostridium saccharobutylicum TaxID=169679 RepID=U5MQI8_CLOSA|nr:SMEK domain-containing protein [Clostridium saccharobutylicum]AGX41911.1 hypothetical protein CLSA_c08990 [Clostridium saccharobutylicum DSM 13864]AQR89189.1 hypothetical protein CLOSC_08860 [Clostridium saccharobutylicum]AQR99090.1 hypothetical protein CSACC_08930 [Clostridium saccharobutylicum]AQS08812.1 hypothetical protein CLOBY_09250 [Clostridium saccharobutylicum]AQS13078.1 hypothetical protein CLOSACC_08930 [Clostridium saccharobutylicum]